VLGDTLRAGAGAALPGLIRLAERHGLAGLEAFAGIPGTVGGAVAGNAGGPPNTPAVGDLCARVRLLEPDGHVAWYDQDRLALRYRHADLRGAVILQVELQLRGGDPDQLRSARQTATRKKASTQPLDARSAGCFFRNPPGESAGRLIDGLGLEGLRRGGASVSTIHANFLVNDGDATPDDVIDLAQEIRRRVHDAKGIELEPEVRLVA
jgi:UDP-N-acetylmuramate dehydrogenase